MSDFTAELLVAVPVYNRLSFVRALSASMIEAENFDKAQVIFYNDASSEITLEELIAAVPPFAQVVDWSTNSGGADFAAHRIFQDFISRDKKHLLLIDSDMVIGTKTLDFCAQNIGQTEGLLSLFNSGSHGVIAEDHPRLVQKKSLGFAATLWRKDIIERILHIEPGKKLDWRICDYLIKQNIGIYCAKESQIQHIGYIGQNASAGSFDYGIGFNADSDAAKAAILTFSDAILCDTLENIKKLQREIKRKRRVIKTLSLLVALLGATALYLSL